ncbi:MAG TPA: ATP-binding protein [Kofleriaceae bacterium]|jgi:signal transduction histidine kinase|nr:ATP-binding protein [Kofleriaceae bacterium]
MAVVESQVDTIRRGYFPLAFATKNFAQRQDDLRGYVDDEPTATNASFTLRPARERRNASFKTLKESVDKLAVSVDPALLPSIEKISVAIDQLRPSYEELTLALRRGDLPTAASVTAPLQALRDGEQRVAQLAKDLSVNSERKAVNVMLLLEEREHGLRLFTIVMGLVALTFAVMISVWVVFTLRPLRRLRAAAARVAAGDYASRIDEKGPAEVADLAREFNSMARAVEERERELVRSERLAAIGKLSAMITHEIRNPLSAIGLNAELLDDELEGNAEGRALCQAIHREVHRLTAITEEYLAFGRLPKPKIASEHVNAMLDALASFVREDLAAKHVELALELGEHDPIALADASQLRQCLINLVRNAAEATAAKGGGKVTLRTRRAGDRVVIEVEDTGVGIPAEVIPRLFDTFFSTKEGGSGLGLALTQQIVKDHGGDLAVESAVGKGTTFTVSIPRG